MRRLGVLVTVIVAGVVACAGTGCAQRAAGGNGVTGVTAQMASGNLAGAAVQAKVGSAVSWPERVLWTEDAAESTADQLLDPGTGVLYLLVPAMLRSGTVSRYVLTAVDLRTGRVWRGASYPVAGLAFAAGELWVYGTAGSAGHLVPVLDEVGPQRLGAIRTVRLPAGSGVAAVTAGPAGSVWAGTANSLFRVSTRTGAVLARTGLPAGLLLGDLAVSPGGGYLYAAAQRLTPAYGAEVLEYSAGSGKLLDRSDAGLLAQSASGASLTALPGGLWVWFRTGMKGMSVLLSGRSLVQRHGPAAGGNAATETSYDWDQSESAIYGAGTLWVMTADGLRACLNPATGAVRAQESVLSAQGEPNTVLAANGATGEVTAVIGDSGGSAKVVGISAPRACRS